MREKYDRSPDRSGRNVGIRHGEQTDTEKGMTEKLRMDLFQAQLITISIPLRIRNIKLLLFTVISLKYTNINVMNHGFQFFV